MPPDSPNNDLVNPFALRAADGYEWLRGNLHSHTTNSDGKPSPQERVDGYVNQGYGFLCMSDHYKITRIDSVEAPDGFVLIQGAELHPENPFGGQTYHFVCLNIREDMDSQAIYPQQVIDRVREQGGSIWQAHPHWSSLNVIRDTIPLRGLAGIEVFNATCRCEGRGESSLIWDDWMDQADRLCPAMANDDAHALESEDHDTYQGWTMVRVRDRSAAAIVEAIERGSAYASNGPAIHDIQIRRVDDAQGDRPVFEATVRSSEAQRVIAVCHQRGIGYSEHGSTFEEATFTLPAGSRWVRFEVIGPDGSKAWSNPFSLTE